jgi:hypothetical protein
VWRRSSHLHPHPPLLGEGNEVRGCEIKGCECVYVCACVCVCPTYTDSTISRVGGGGLYLGRIPTQPSVNICIVHAACKHLAWTSNIEVGIHMVLRSSSYEVETRSSHKKVRATGSRERMRLRCLHEGLSVTQYRSRDLSKKPSYDRHVLQHDIW